MNRPVDQQQEHMNAEVGHAVLGEVRIYRSTIQELNAAAHNNYSSVEPFGCIIR